MKELIAWPVFVGFIIGLVAYAERLWNDVVPQITPGEKYIYVSLAIVAGFAYWNYVGVRAYFNDESGMMKYHRTVTKLLAGVFGLIWLGAILASILHHYHGDNSILAGTSEVLLLTDRSLWGIFQWVFMVTFIAGATTGLFFTFLLMGKLGLGITLGLTLHNWANGAGFDPSLVLEGVVGFLGEVGLSDLAGIIFSIIWFFLTTLVLKRGDDALSDVLG